jgi:hypothetical protein
MIYNKKYDSIYPVIKRLCISGGLSISFIVVGQIIQGPNLDAPLIEWIGAPVMALWSGSVNHPAFGLGVELGQKVYEIIIFLIWFFLIFASACCSGWTFRISVYGQVGYGVLSVWIVLLRLLRG